MVIPRSDPSTLDGPVRTLFERIAGPAADPLAADLPAIGAALIAFAQDLDYVTRWLERLGTTSGALPIHAPARGPRLSIVHRPEGEMGSVHDHGTWIALTPVVGLETHRRYRVTGRGAAARPELVETLSLEPAQLATLLPPDDLHDHGHLAGHGAPAHVLILAGDDQFLTTRNEWDLATGRHRILLPGERGRWLASESMPGPGEMGPRLRRCTTPELAPAVSAAIRDLLRVAFGGDDAFADDDWRHALGGTHVIVDDGTRVIAHASVVERELWLDERPVRTGYVEAVAVAPDHQGSGLGSLVMNDVAAVIRDGFELGALSTGRPTFYERLGWRRWLGPTAARGPAGIQRTPDDDDGILVLATPSSPALDVTASISCDWRPGDVW